MSKGIKINGFIKDIGGADRVTKVRREKYELASAVPDPKDAIRELADKLHPQSMRLKVTDIRDASPTARPPRREPSALSPRTDIFRYSSADNM